MRPLSSAAIHGRRTTMKRPQTPGDIQFVALTKRIDRLWIDWVAFTSSWLGIVVLSLTSASSEVGGILIGIVFGRSGKSLLDVYSSSSTKDTAVATIVLVHLLV